MQKMYDFGIKNNLPEILHSFLQDRPLSNNSINLLPGYRWVTLTLPNYAVDALTEQATFFPSIANPIATPTRELKT